MVSFSLYCACYLVGSCAFKGANRYNVYILCDLGSGSFLFTKNLSFVLVETVRGKKVASDFELIILIETKIYLC